MKTWTIFIPGTARPKGSMQAFVVSNKDTGATRAVITEKRTSESRQWQWQVKYFANQKWEGPPTDDPVCVAIEFRIERPKSAPKKRIFPAVTPDIDKLARGVLDALAKVVFKDDRQVVGLVATKVYHEQPGVVLTVWTPDTPKTMLVA